MKESQRKGYCSRHLTVNSREERCTEAYCFSTAFVSSADWMGNSSEHGRGELQRKFDENEAANMLVSLGDHQLADRNPRLLPEPVSTDQVPPTLAVAHSRMPVQFSSHQLATTTCQLQAPTNRNCQSQVFQTSSFTLGTSVSTADGFRAANVPVRIVNPSLSINIVTTSTVSSDTSKIVSRQSAGRLVLVTDSMMTMSQTTSASSACVSANCIPTTQSSAPSQMTSTVSVSDMCSGVQRIPAFRGEKVTTFATGSHSLCSSLITTGCLSFTLVDIIVVVVIVNNHRVYVLFCLLRLHSAALIVAYAQQLWILLSSSLGNHWSDPFSSYDL